MYYPETILIVLENVNHVKGHVNHVNGHVNHVNGHVNHVNGCVSLNDHGVSQKRRKRKYSYLNIIA